LIVYSVAGFIIWEIVKKRQLMITVTTLFFVISKTVI
jgi:hypothetical protein